MYNEIWKSIIGYEGIYEISNTRKIKSLRRKSLSGNILKEKYLKFCKKEGGSEVVTLTNKEGKKKNYYIDKLMYYYFEIDR